eukprot:2116315-Alexandrium_andersonii.AAC.1
MLLSTSAFGLRLGLPLCAIVDPPLLLPRGALVCAVLVLARGGGMVSGLLALGRSPGRASRPTAGEP